MCKFWYDLAYKTQILPCHCFPTHFGFCMGRFKATGLHDKQINPLTPKDTPLADETQTKQGQEDYIFAAHAVLVLWTNERFWQAELFIWLLSYSKFISSHFSRRQDKDWKIAKNQNKTWWNSDNTAHSALPYLFLPNCQQCCQGRDTYYWDSIFPSNKLLILSGSAEPKDDQR